MTGYIFLVLAGICQGSFGVGYKKYTPLSWEMFWTVYNIFCLAVATAWTFFTRPDLVSVLSGADAGAIWLPFLCGMVWGLSTIAFSKSVLMIGMSLCFGVNMGVSAVVGSVIPFFMANSEASSKTVLLFILSVIVTLCGIAIITKAGMDRDKGAGEKNLKTGAALAVISGICSGMMNVGFDLAAPLSVDSPSVAAESAVQWFPVLCGGTLAAAVCCFILALKNKSVGTIMVEGAGSRLGKLFLTSIVWFAALALYGIASRLTLGAGIGWIIFNALALIVSNLWGLKMGEWKNCHREKKLLLLGNAVLVLSWAIMAVI